MERRGVVVQTFNVRSTFNRQTKWLPSFETSTVDHRHHALLMRAYSCGQKEKGTFPRCASRINLCSPISCLNIRLYTSCAFKLVDRIHHVHAHRITRIFYVVRSAFILKPMHLFTGYTIMALCTVRGLGEVDIH